MRFKKGKIIITAILVGTVAVGVAYAAAVNTLSFVERFETGKVGVDLEQLTVTENGEAEAVPDIVEANKDVSYIPRFTCTGADCYMRAKVEIVMGDESCQPLGDENIYGLSEDWVKQGEYFYCTKSMAQGQQSDLFKGIHIPADWDPGNAKGFSVIVTAEAIQSSNFAPDFSAELPWGAVMLEDIAIGSECYRAAEPVVKTADIHYRSGGGFECSTEDLFHEFRNMMPGDKCEKKVKITNDSKNALRLYLDVTSGDTMLHEKMTLKVTYGEEVLYYGVMSEVCRNESFRLADVNGGKSVNLKFEIGLPLDAGNEHVDTMADLVWEIKAEELPAKAVQTDDWSNILPYAAVAGVAGLSVLGLILFRRKES